MKKMIKLLSAIFLVGTLISSCDNDDDNSKNYLKVDGVEYDLSDGIIINYGEGDFHKGVNIALVLYSKEISIEDDVVTTEGIGQMIYLDMFSSKGTELDEGVYTLADSEPYPIGSFSYGDYNINYSYSDETDETDEVEEETFDDEVEFVGGTVTVSKNGNEYTIEIDCVDKGNHEITGYYQGTLNYFDYTVYNDMSASLNSSKAQKHILKN